MENIDFIHAKNTQRQVRKGIWGLFPLCRVQRNMSGRYSTLNVTIKVKMDSLLNVDFWIHLAPYLHINQKKSSPPFPLLKTQKKKFQEQIVREGYVHLIQPGLQCPFQKIATLFQSLFSLGLPPVFSFIYDELWSLAAQSDNLIAAILHPKYAILPHFWAWRVMPGEAGWKPHRDKIAGSLFPDHRPKSLTLWIPITQSHPLNGCIYILPADRDEEYGLENSVRGIGPLPDIRALPAESGDVLAWTQHLFHWSGHAADLHDLSPRMSIAFEFQRCDIRPFKSPLIAPHVPLTFSERLALIAKQLSQYRHMDTPGTHIVRLTEKIATQYKLPKDLFHDTEEI